MTRKEFQDLVRDNVIFLDGATGSNLQKRGMPNGVCPEQWILENKEVMLQLQKEYVAAGTNILYSPTFTANRIKLAEFGLENDILQINKELVSSSGSRASHTTSTTILPSSPGMGSSSFLAGRKSS